MGPVIGSGIPTDRPTSTALQADRVLKICPETEDAGGRFGCERWLGVVGWFLVVNSTQEEQGVKNLAFAGS